MRQIVRFFFLFVLMATAANAEEGCAEFQQLVKSTYDFKPSKLSKAEQDVKSKAMDKVWNVVKASPATLLPCLRAAIDDPKADPFFRFDGSNMLVTFDPTEKSKLVQISACAAVDLDDVDPETWVTTLALRGAENFDTTAAAERWLGYSKNKAKYSLPRHGGFEVTWDLAAVFLYGTMDEKYATPALLKIVAQKEHPARTMALSLLCLQATPESNQALQQMDAKTLSADELKLVAEIAKAPPLKPSAVPKITREECLVALKGLADGDRKKFEAFIQKEPDSEADMVAVLKPEDLPVLRQARRRNLSAVNQHVINNHISFTKVIAGLLARPEFAPK